METVIQEIANQLGMAVNQAGQFITEQLPNFAALKIMQNIVPLVIVWILFLILFSVAIVAISLTVRARSKARKE